MRKSKIWILLLVVIVLVSFVLPATTFAQEDGPRPTPSDDEVNAIAKNMYCPVCENIPLDACGTQACIQWRQQIKDKLEEGWTEEQIYDYFVELYGDRVLAEPPRRGLNWLIYILPPAAFIAGAYVLYRGFRSWRKPVEELEKEAEAVTGDDEYITRLEEELKSRQ
jgi:cytochrome c-type biogenesis protein CcmH